MEIKENVRLAPLTTLQVGGNAKYFVTAENEFAVIEALAFAREMGLAVFILGGGSNLLISDSGFDGLVVQMKMDRSDARKWAEEDGYLDGSGLEIDEPGSRRFCVGAGESWDDFVKFCVENDFAGVECLSGIPGSVGGTPIQNVGAYGQEVSESILAVRCIDTVNLRPIRITNVDCKFAYRSSIFNTSEVGRYVVYDVTFLLKYQGSPKVVYKDLIEHFGERRPSLTEVREAVLNIRRSKSMVIDADDPNSRSAGSFFKNPIVSCDKLAELQAEMGNIPNFPFGDAVKIPAAWLIEKSGLHKGFSLGNVGISSNHTLAIINRGGATANDIFVLKDEIQRTVADKFGIMLDPEPVFVGF
ncbi:MAG: UDP-N-acetylmuramate dehydrogenase [Chloracidobacterium sp.]|nr:UDP-N-acetylmuramate dehydrogenase [Chloracidobacterium sp.]